VLVNACICVYFSLCVSYTYACVCVCMCECVSVCVCVAIENCVQRGAAAKGKYSLGHEHAPTLLVV